MTPLETKQQTLRGFIRYIGEECENDFYRNHWNENGAAAYDLSVPPIDAEAFINVSFHDRKYKHEPGLVKVVRHKERPFLSKWTRKDIENETYGIPSKRPLVFLTDRAETLEKAWWFYEHNILPAAGEHNNPPASAYLAKWFEADHLLTDMAMYQTFLPLMEKEYDSANIKTLTLFDAYFDASVLNIASKFDTTRLILGLPEVGSIAHACPEALANGALVFHPDKHAVVEADGLLIVSKLSFLTTPIIRYRTTMLATPTGSHTCSCDHDNAHFILQ